MAAVEAVWGPTALRFLRVAVANTTKVVRTKLSSTSRAVQSGSAGVRTGYTGRQPIHPSALLRQQKRPARWFSGPSAKNVEQAVRRFIAKATSEGSAARSSRFDRSNSNIARQMAQGAGRAPFSSTLRPNLTGGALPRSAGGYGIGGGGARYFSHGPAAPAQVVQNVSQAMRAFFLSGQKLRYDGLGQNGERQYRGVSSLEDKAMTKFQAVSHRTPGAFIDFHLQPTVTSVGPLAAAVAQSLQSTYGEEKIASDVTLNADGFLAELSADFERTLKDLNATYADIQRLAILGDLPIMLQKGNTLRVRFPGMDTYALENLCDDIGITRGVIGQDEQFLSDESDDPAMTLQFPFAPESDKTITSPGGSERSVGSHEGFDEVSSLSSDDSFVRDALMDEMADNPWMSENGRGYESSVQSKQTKASKSEDFEGLEGIYRFLEECDRAKTRF